MAYYNMEGTTKKTFKIGRNGVLLSTENIQIGEKFKKYLIVENQLDSERNPSKIAYLEDVEEAFNVFIPNKDILSIGLSDNGTRLSIQLKGGGTLKIGGDVTGPASAVDNNIAVFDGTSGKVIKDSGSKIVSEIVEGTEQNPNNDIPTSDAVVNYVGQFSELLNTRLNGNI